MKSCLPELMELMKSNDLNELVIRTFADQYNKILSGESGIIHEREILPPDKESIIEYNTLSDDTNANLDKLAVIKLNGGLGTSMGLKKAKSLLRARGQYTFLDIISLQILELRKLTGARTPLIFMNSFNTRKDTLDFLSKYENLKIADLPLDFVQNKFPKIKQEDLSPLDMTNDQLNWNPPGHGEIYTVLHISGILDLLLEKGYKYAFISNSDNLGAVVDNRILNYLDGSDVPFIVEVCQRTEMDKKGGHLAASLEGQLLLREIAQCPNEEIVSFQDIDKYKYFNTNNLWLNLEKLKEKMKETDYVLSLPLILNKKEVGGTGVYQIETAMGAAINSFTGSKAIKVGRDRFIPVKKTNDLLSVWSDTYKLTSDYKLKLDSSSGKAPVITLDEEYYKTIDQLQERILEVPSLKKCNNLSIKGNISIAENVVFENDVDLSSEENVVLRNKTFS